MFDKKFVLSTLPDAKIIHDTFPPESSFSIDTRTIKQGDIFVALAGTHVDGHDFVKQALEKGAGGLLINTDRQDMLKNCPAVLLQKKLVIVVRDTYKALYAFSAAWRAQFNYPVVGITGSIGKTSTKEMVSNVVALTGKPYVATYGNYSSQLGLAHCI